MNRLPIRSRNWLRSLELAKRREAAALLADGDEAAADEVEREADALGVAWLAGEPWEVVESAKRYGLMDDEEG